MGTISHQRTSRCKKMVSIIDREETKITIDDNVTRSKMGRRQTVSSKKNSLQPNKAVPSQDSSTQSFKKKQQQSQQRHQHLTTTPVSCHGKLDSKSRSTLASGNLQENDQQQQHREHMIAGSGGARQAPDSALRHQFDSMLDLNKSRPFHPSSIKQCRGEDSDSGSDISESERLPVFPSSCTPPQLHLRPEVIHPDDLTSHSQGQRARSHNTFLFPDFLPPPFNSWSLSQLAVFFNMEGRAATRPRPVGPLERYLERLLQLEWRQIQTVQDERGRCSASEVLAGTHRPHAAAATAARLSSPKSILQCQRAFPLTFLSSLASHSALLSGCACSLCRLRYSTCSVTCCHSPFGHARHSRPSPARSPESFPPKRSYSEGRVPSADKTHRLAYRALRFASPVRGNGHLKRMQAFGNIRNPAKSATGKPHSTSRNSSVGAARKLACSEGGDIPAGERRLVGQRTRSGSEHRRGGSDRWRNGSEDRKTGLDHRKGGSERKGAGRAEKTQIKPDVNSILNNMPAGSKDYKIRQSQLKQVEFVT